MMVVVTRFGLAGLLASACLVDRASAQCEAAIAACEEDGTCSTCRQYGTRCNAPGSAESAWSDALDSAGPCGSADLWDYGGLNLDGSLASFDANGAAGDQTSASSGPCEC